MRHRITRQEESTLPKFSNHQEARQWFKFMYGDDFMLTTVEGDIYFYYLILNRKRFDEEMAKLNKGTLGDSSKLLSSYQPVQISADGSVHIVH